MLRILLSYLAGIFIQSKLGIPLPGRFSWYFLGLAIMILVALAWRKYYTLELSFFWGGLVYLIFFSLGIMRYEASTFQVQHLASPTHTIEDYLLFEVQSYEEKDEYISVIAKIIGKTSKKCWNFKFYGKARIFLSKNASANQCLPGKKGIFKRQLKKISVGASPYGFNPAKYWAIKGVTYQVWLDAKEVNWLPENNHFTWRKWIASKQQYTFNLLTKNLKGQQLGIATALVLGNKSHLDYSTKKAFIDSGAIHVLAVSGLHVGLVCMIINFVLKGVKVFLPIPEYCSLAIMSLGLLFYAFFTGATPSVCRSVLMFIFWQIAISFKLNGGGLSGILFSAFLLLWLKPMLLMDVGFQLSYVAVIGIVFIYPIIEPFFIFSNSILRYLWGLIAVSLAAQIATLPISLYYFHQFPTYFIISGILIVPATMLALIMGILLIALSHFTYLSIWLGFVLDEIIKLICLFATSIQNLPYSLITDVWLEPPEVLCYYAMVYLIMANLKGKKKYLKYIYCLLILIMLGKGFYAEQEKITSRAVALYADRKGLLIHIIKGKEGLLLSGFKRDSTQIAYIKSGLESRLGVTGANTLVWNNLSSNHREKDTVSVLSIDNIVLAFVTKKSKTLPPILTQDNTDKIILFIRLDKQDLIHQILDKQYIPISKLIDTKTKSQARHNFSIKMNHWNLIDQGGLVLYY